MDRPSLEHDVKTANQSLEHDVKDSYPVAGARREASLRTATPSVERDVKQFVSCPQRIL